MTPTRPTLLIVHGLPASGKTTLAKWLAQQLDWPAIYKDEVKEILFDTIGWKDRAFSRMLGVATIEVLFHVITMQLAAGVSCLAECNFKPELASPKLRAILAKSNAHSIQVLCRADGLVRLQRFQSRARHPGHADGEVNDALATEWQAESLAPLDLNGPLIEVNTTDLSALNYDALLHQVRAHLI